MLRMAVENIKRIISRMRSKKVTGREIDQRLREEEVGRPTTWVPPGHFYSPIPSLEEIRSKEKELFAEIPREIPGIDMNVEEQLRLFDHFKKYYGEQPFEAQKKNNMRYFFENPAYLYSDAIFLHCMIRHFKPRRIIEIGSGYSSCVMLDTNELFFNNEIQCTFIEPYPELLLSLMKAADKDRVEIISHNLQDIAIKKFENLTEGDFLFVDSTHVSKINSDVNYIFFKVLPMLSKGVYIHFHDIFYPFEYPKEWVYEGRSWNEAYILRAFLEYNNSFKIIFFNTFLEHFYEDIFLRQMPLCLKNRGGSIWLKKG
jgi:predicted O-methyltransferase YrrM